MSGLHGSHIFGLTNFPDFSLTFPVYFFDLSLFFSVLFNEYNKYKNLLNKYISSKNSEKKNNKKEIG